MMEKSPVASLFARCLRFLSPAYMLEQPEICEEFFEKIPEKLVCYKKILAKDADAAKLEYSNGLTKIVNSTRAAIELIYFLEKISIQVNMNKCGVFSNFFSVYHMDRHQLREVLV